MFLILEDYVWGIGSKHEVINSRNICRIRISRKRIKIWTINHRWNYIYVGKTKHNMDELKKIEVM